MNRESIIRLIQCIAVPFVGMFAAGRLSGWLLAGLGMTDWVVDFGGFLLAALTAAFLYRCLDPTRWGDVFRETASVPCSLPLAAAHVGYGLLWLTGLLYAVTALFPVEMTEDARGLAGAVFSAVLVHPVLEEWLFRRVFLTRLLVLSEGDPPAPEVVDEEGSVPAAGKQYTRAGMLFAVLTQAVLFALMHTGGGAMLYGFGGGVILGILMLRTGRLWVPVAAHMAVNLRSVLWPMLPGTVSFAADLVLISAGLVCGLCFWITRIRQKKNREEPL